MSKECIFLQNGVLGNWVRQKMFVNTCLKFKYLQLKTVKTTYPKFNSYGSKYTK